MCVVGGLDTVIVGDIGGGDGDVGTVDGTDIVDGIGEII